MSSAAVVKESFTTEISAETQENKQNPHIGSSLDELLEEDGALAETRAATVKRVLAFQMRQAIEQQGITNSELASRMRTSRAALDRLLNPENKSATLLSLSRAAAALGKDLRIELVERSTPATAADAPVRALSG